MAQPSARKKRPAQDAVRLKAERIDGDQRSAPHRNPVLPDAGLNSHGEPRRQMGRPPAPYDPERAKVICVRIALGENIIDILRDENLTWATLASWRVRNSDFAQTYAHARMSSAEMLEAQALAAVRDANAVNFQAKRLLADTLKWAAAKRNPRVYGDKIEVKGDPDNPVMVEHVHVLRQELIRRLGAMAIPEPLTIEQKTET